MRRLVRSAGGSVVALLSLTGLPYVIYLLLAVGKVADVVGEFVGDEGEREVRSVGPLVTLDPLVGEIVTQFDQEFKLANCRSVHPRAQRYSSDSWSAYDSAGWKNCFWFRTRISPQRSQIVSRNPVVALQGIVVHQPTIDPVEIRVVGPVGDFLDDLVGGSGFGAATTAASSKETAGIADDGEATAQRAIDDSREVQTAIDATVESVESLDDRMAGIDEIVQLIGDIAEQTNVLALNANVKAAHAGGTGGAPGDGFAVVADGVNSLAERTQDSDKEIGDRRGAGSNRSDCD